LTQIKADMSLPVSPVSPLYLSPEAVTEVLKKTRKGQIKYERHVSLTEDAPRKSEEKEPEDPHTKAIVARLSSQFRSFAVDDSIQAKASNVKPEIATKKKSATQAGDMKLKAKPVVVLNRLPEETATASPTSAVDQALFLLEWRRKRDLEVAKRTRELRTRRSLEALRSSAAEDMRRKIEFFSTERRRKAEKDAAAAAEAEVRERQLLQSLRNEAKQKSQNVLKALQDMEEKEKEEANNKAGESLSRAIAAAKTVDMSLVVSEDFQSLIREGEELMRNMDAARALSVAEALDGSRPTMEAAARQARERKVEEERQRVERTARAAAEEKVRLEKEEREKLQREEAQRRREAEFAKQEMLAAEANKAPAVKPVSTSTVEDKLLPQISPANAQKLQALLTLKMEWQSKIDPLASTSADAGTKTFRFNCQKAVTTAINAIGTQSSAHLKDKLDRLRAILAGQAVEAGGGTRVSVAEHPLGVAFCMNFTAKKLVQQGPEVTTRRPENGFAYAVVIVALWAEFPDFGQLFLAHLYETCPYLVPCHYQPRPDEAEETYYKRLGYRYDDDGLVEKQDKFLDRLDGYAQLYAAITTAHVAKAVKATRQHPHGYGHAWTLLASTANLQPVSDVTATVIYRVLEIAGHALFSAYGKMFSSLLEVLRTQYMAKVEAATLDGRSGPVTRLADFLQKAVTSGTIQKPQKELKEGFI